MSMRVGVGMKWLHASGPRDSLFFVRRRKTTLELSAAGRKRPSEATVIFDGLPVNLDAAPRASASMGSMSVIRLMLRSTFRVDGPHLRTREKVDDGSYPVSLL